ncbi:MAG: hypothetical protein HOV81_31115 [Kofleriaceae bacterium]|nr:hypothetical protein [Kofleriaceae bacterium]
MRLHGLLILCCALGACYNPSYGDCQVSCASGTCPSGLECQGGVCRAPGMTGPCTTPDAGGDGGGGIPLEMMTEAQLDALCNHAVQCGQFEDVPSCKAVYGNLIVPASDEIAAVNAGTVIYHGDKAKECLDAQTANLACERWKFASNRAADPACSAVFEGTRHNGDACAIAEQCISQNCMYPATCTPGNGACCEGTCVGDEPPGPRAIGQACTFRDRCTGGYCDQFTGVCATYKTAGTQCSYGDQCADGLVCDNTTPNAVCQQPVGTNGPCSSSNVCANLGDVCRNGACMPGGLTGAACASLGECQQLHQCLNNACALPSEIGGSCQGLGVCSTGYCFQGTCVAKIMDNGACDVSLGSQQCESNYCDPGGKCMPKPVCN